MTLRSFSDSAGMEWTVLEVVPDEVLAGGANVAPDPYSRGWLLFRSEGGRGEKRRLAPYPAEWTSFGPEALEALCARAEPAPNLGLSGTSLPDAPSDPAGRRLGGP